MALVAANVTPPDVPTVGSIRAALETKEPVEHVWAIEQRVRTLTTSKGEVHKVGTYSRAYEGVVADGKIVIENLPVPGQYDLKLQTRGGGIVWGWDANVPESDYMGDPPLEEASRRKILEKLSDQDFSSFADGMWVLDIQGNIQNAAVLVAKLRTRPFVGGDYTPGEWVWRVERWQWENPDEHTWVPFRKRPSYALCRERLGKKQYEAKRVVFARHVGGIALTEECEAVDLGTVKVPRPAPGVCAANPDGSRIRPVVLKGADTDEEPAEPQIGGSEEAEEGDAE